MVVEGFPRTENVGANSLCKKVDRSATSHAVRIYPLPYAIPSRKSEFQMDKVPGRPNVYGRIDPQRRRGIMQVIGFPKGQSLQSGQTQASMLRVNPIGIEQATAISSWQLIPDNSPLYPFQFLKAGWDGYRAEPLSQEVIFRAHQLWRHIKKISTEQQENAAVQPAANGSIAFTWSHQYPEKELEIWLYDQTSYYAEWMLSFHGDEQENTARSQTELLKAIKQYQEL